MREQDQARLSHQPGCLRDCVL